MTKPIIVKPALVEARAAGRPSRDAAAELREAFLQSALDSFVEQGYLGASIEGIARAAKVNKDTIYRQFGSKEKLYREVVMHALAHLRASLQALAATAGAPENVLLKFIRQIYDEVTSPNALAVIRMTVAQSQHFPDLAGVLKVDCMDNLTGLEGYLARLAAQGVLSLDDPKEAAMQLATHTTGGIGFLLARPLEGARARNRWARSVLAFLLKAWGYQPAAARPR